MKITFQARRAATAPGAAHVFSANCISAQQSHRVHSGPGGKLVHTCTSRGNRIPDFSSAGQEGDRAALPRVPAKRTVKPFGKDDTEDPGRTDSSGLDSEE